MLDRLASLFNKFLIGDDNKKALKLFAQTVERISDLESQISSLSDEALRAKTQEFKDIIRKKLEETPFEQLIPDDVTKMPGQIRTSHDKVLQEVLEELLPETFAICREAAKRVLHMRHFDVQLIGGIQLHRGGIAEMQTGEGKTLVCTLPAYLNALTGKGVHIITVNDYLAKRDSEWMGAIYKFLGLSVGLVINSKTQRERKAAYSCDITYGTNNEFGFDYLRDNMESSMEDCVQRPYYMAIVDEVDSILIDEARTPLIISGIPETNKQDIYIVMNKTARQLNKGLNEKDKSNQSHYYVDEKAKNVILTDSGIKRAEEILGVKDLWNHETNFAHHLIQALKAKELYVKDVDYIVKQADPGKDHKKAGGKEVIIVDEFTGRLMEGRRWGDGLHQAVEAKEGVNIQEETLTMATITFQNLFRLYPKLSGMTGTAQTEAEEFEKIYSLGVLQIPTNRPNIRKNLNDIVFKTEKAKFIAIAEDIVKAMLEGRPILVGTTSIDKSEHLASILSKPAVAMSVLQTRIQRLLVHLKKHDMQDPDLEQLLKLLDRPGNITTEKLHPCLKKINQQIQKSGSMDEDFQFALSGLENIVVVLDEIRKGIKLNVLNAKHHEKEAAIIRQAGKPGAVTIATNMAGRGTDIILGGYLSNNPDDLKYNQIDLEAQRFVCDKGGLYVIGTERHESRRIDNQLRGRTGRQGDPGSSRFYLSLEDNLMRIFGGDKIITIMNMLKADEDLPIEAGMVSGAINNAQKKVEAHNFDIRKHLLQYDDVINTQREVIYRERRLILQGKNIQESILEMINEHVDNIIYSHITPNTPKEIWSDDSNGPSALTSLLGTLKSDFGDQCHLDKDIFELEFITFASQIKDKVLSIYKAKEETVSSEALREAERQVMLHVIDSKWVEHLHGIDSLKEGIHLQGYGQKDPLIVYKKEAFDMFEELLNNIRRDTVILLFHAQIVRNERRRDALINNR